MTRQPAAVALAVLVIASASAGSVPFGTRFSVTVLRQDHFWERELEIAVGPNAEGTARVKFTGDRRGEPWNAAPVDATCRLDSLLVGEFRTLLQKANVFENQGSGTDARGQHFPLETLWVEDAGRTVATVVSFNEAYESGVRQRLIKTLRALDATLSSKRSPEVCTLASITAARAA